jgi:hypothetical protein
LYRLLCPVALLACCASIAAAPTRAAGTPSARLGVYYFDGWAGPLTTFFFSGLIDSPYSGRRPLSGWRDDTPESLDRQLGWAHDAGIGFFSFLWYYDAESRTDGGQSLNHALANYRALPNHHGVDYALYYANGPGGEIPASAWPAVSEEWAAKMADPDYERIDGKPVLFIHNSFYLSQQLGGEPVVNRVFAGLRAAARRHGLPGVYIIGGIAMQQGEDWTLGGKGVLSGQTYDAMTQYNYPTFAGVQPGERTYSDVVRSAEDFWDVMAHDDSYRFIPAVMAGWDPRPWNVMAGGQLFWFKRSAAEVGAFVRDAVDWTSRHPAMAVEPRGAPPLVMLESWNELGEGAQIVPTDEARFTFMQAIAHALGVEWTPAMWQLNVKLAPARGAITIRAARRVCRTTCTVAIADGTMLTLVAAAVKGYHFSKWSACSGSVPRCDVTVQDDTAVSAFFVRRRRGH